MANVYYPKGFLSISKNIGIKESKLDFTVILTKSISNVAAVFTKNTFCGCNILMGRESIKDGQLNAIIVLSGVANVATGQQGVDSAKDIIMKVSKELLIDPNNVLLSCTGVIGQQLPVDKVLVGIEGISGLLEENQLYDSALAIMTTDKASKIRSVKIGDVTLLGMAKGAGMIEPNMATMLVYFFTDAKIDKGDLKQLLEESVSKSFNMISIDSDMSTSDTVVIMANGEIENVDLDQFKKEFNLMCVDLAQDIVSGGEGTKKMIEVNVFSARDFKQAKKVAKSIVNSLLVKTAIYGCDPNWGRVAMAIGKTMDEDIDPFSVCIKFGDTIVYDKGRDIVVEEDVLKRYLNESFKCQINVELNIGNGRATVWGNDLNEEYIRINALYTT